MRYVETIARCQFHNKPYASKSICHRLAAKKRWFLTKIVYFRVKTSWRKHKDPITNNSYIAERYGKRQTFQAFQELIKFSFCVDHEKRTSAKSYCRPATEKNYHNPITLGNWTLLELLPTRFYPEQLDTNSKLDHPDLTQSWKWKGNQNHSFDPPLRFLNSYVITTCQR